MLTLGVKSLLNRRFVVCLTVLSIALSVALILGVERLRNEARNGFANSASGLDMIVAPRGDDVQILLATVFGVGSTGAGISWESFETLTEHPSVKWAVPIMMGDNHRGFPVIGTSPAYFEHFRHSGGKELRFSQGASFQQEDSAVIGSEVAATFGYRVGDQIVNAHGAGNVSFEMHDDAPFSVKGILAPTGTAVDRMVFVSLEGFDAIHATKGSPPVDPFSADGTLVAEPTDVEDHDHETPETEPHADAADHEDEHHTHEHAPDQVNAVYVGLTNRAAVLSLQRWVAEYKAEPLTGVLPGVALLSLWEITGTAESALRLMALAVALAGMIGLVVMLSATLDLRRREFAILRSVGATPATIFGMIVLEATLVTFLGSLLGVAMMILAILLSAPVLSAQFGLFIEPSFLSPLEIWILCAILCCGLLASLIPAVRVYRMTLSDGLNIRI